MFNPYNTKTCRNQDASKIGREKTTSNVHIIGNDHYVLLVESRWELEELLECILQ